MERAKIEAMTHLQRKFTNSSLNNEQSIVLAEIRKSYALVHPTVIYMRYMYEYVRIK